MIALATILTLGLTSIAVAFGEDKETTLETVKQKQITKIVFREPVKENQEQIKIKPGRSVKQRNKLQNAPIVDPLALIQKYFPMTEWKNAEAVARCESGLIPNRVGDTNLKFYKNNTMYGMSYGVFQIRHLPGRPSPDELIKPEVNVKYAYGMWKVQGWVPWTCAKKLNIR